MCIHIYIYIYVYVLIYIYIKVYPIYRCIRGSPATSGLAVWCFPDGDMFTPERHLPTPGQRGHSPQRHTAAGTAPTTTDTGNTVPQRANPTQTAYAHPLSLQVRVRAHHLVCSYLSRLGLSRSLSWAMVMGKRIYERSRERLTITRIEY